MEPTVIVKRVYPKWHVFKGLAIAGFGYLCYKGGKLIQKIVDAYDIQHGTVSFEKKEETT